MVIMEGDDVAADAANNDDDNHHDDAECDYGQSTAQLRTSNRQ